MNNQVINILKEKPLIIPKVLFKNYKKLNITEEELIILIYIINIGDKIIYDPGYLTNELDIDKNRYVIKSNGKDMTIYNFKKKIYDKNELYKIGVNYLRTNYR